MTQYLVSKVHVDIWICHVLTSQDKGLERFEALWRESIWVAGLDLYGLKLFGIRLGVASDLNSSRKHSDKTIGRVIGVSQWQRGIKLVEQAIKGIAERLRIL